MLRTRPSPLPHHEELALARRVIDADADKVLKEGDLNDKVQHPRSPGASRARARARGGREGQVPRPVLQRHVPAAGRRGDGPRRPGRGRRGRRVGPDADGPGDGLCRRSSRPSTRSPENRARRLELLDQALLQARGVKEADKRPLCLGRIADRLLELGETDKATKLLREGEKLARELPNAAFAGYVRGAFAEELAQIDLDAALALTKDLSDPREFDRHHGNIAHELAGKDPAAAERVLAMVRNRRQRDSRRSASATGWPRWTCPAPGGSPEVIQHTLMKPYALGMMAQALAGSEKTRPVAAELLAAAFDEHGQVGRRRHRTPSTTWRAPP